MPRSSLIILLSFLVLIPTQAQQSMVYFESEQDFKIAKIHYDEGLYRAAQILFQDIVQEKNTSPSIKEKSAFYETICAVLLNDPGAIQRLNPFLTNHYGLIYGTNTYIKLADHYLIQGHYAKAYDSYIKASNNTNPTEYKLKRGYTALMLKKYDEALPLLKQAIVSPYRKQALYYAGHIVHIQKNYSEALRYFNPLKEDPIYSLKVLPYIAQIHYEQGKYQEAIQTAKTFLKIRPQSKVKGEISKIIADSYFRLKHYESAIPYLEAYRQLQGELSKSDHYQLGYAYYQKKDDKKAIAHFKKTIGQEDVLAQAAHYQLAHAYLRTRQKQEALLAFQSAAQMDYDPSVKEDAWLNYAKLSYDLGNPFESTPDVLQNYLKTYPNSVHQAEIHAYLASAYSLSGNHKRALEILSDLKEKKTALKAAEQKIAYLYGIQLFHQKKYEEALTALERAINIPLTTYWKENATYWKGETLFCLGRYQAALQAYKTAHVPSEKNLDYALGYAYLKSKDYTQAANAFKGFISKSADETLKKDALLRLADSYYGTKKYQAALELYEKVEKSQVVEADYAAYQKVLSYDRIGKRDQMTQALERFVSKYPHSHYRKQALLKLGNAKLKIGQTTQAIIYYDELIQQYPESNTAAQAQLKIGLAQLYQGQNEKALQAYKLVLEKYPHTEEATEAMQNVKNIYVERGHIEEYQKWTQSIGYSEPSEIEKLSFDAAEQQLIKGQLPEAEKLLKSYIKKYSHSEKILLAQFYLGEVAFQMKKYDEAISSLTRVAMADHANKDEAQKKLVEIYLKKRQKTKALFVLKSLYQSTKYPSYHAFAGLKLMQLYSEMGKHSKASELAQILRTDPKSDQLIQEAATIVQARAALNRQDFQKAREFYISLKTAQNMATRAEALYQEAYFKHQEKKYKASNELIFELASQCSEQQYWGAKAIVLMAKNYHRLKDVYQTIYTLKNLIKNFSQYPDIQSEAQELLDQVDSKKRKKSR